MMLHLLHIILHFVKEHTLYVLYAPGTWVVFLIYEMTQGVNKNQLVIITNKHQINQLYCMH